MRILSAWLLMSAMAWAEPATYVFRWEGAGEHLMTGAFSFAPELVEGPYVLADDLTCFEIAGVRAEEPLGRWALGMLLPGTTWRFHFHPQSGSLPVDGDAHGIVMPQAWNMDGAGYNCGTPGFGFNAGNFAQDLCVDGDLIEESQVPPESPFLAQPGAFDFAADACRQVPLLSSWPLR